jgi:hypothetical protein
MSWSVRARAGALIGAAGVVTASLAGTALVAIAATTAQADSAVATFNPFDVNEGFTILSRGDAKLGNAEVEGSVAAFGTLSTTAPQGKFTFLQRSAGTGEFTVPEIDGERVRVLAGNLGAVKAEMSNERATSIETGSEAIGKFGSLGSYAFSTNSLLKITDGANFFQFNALSGVESNVGKLKAAKSDVSEYFTDTEQRIAASTQCLNQLTTAPNALAAFPSVGEEGGMAKLTGLSTTQPNVITLPLTGETWDHRPLTFTGIKLGSFRPSAQAPLIFKVPAGTTTLPEIKLEGFSANGEDQKLASYILWDLSDVTGDFTLQPQVLGAVYAPNTDLTVSAALSVNGQWLSQDFTSTGDAEIHHHNFTAELPCVKDVPSSSAAPSTSETPTTETTVSTSEAPTTETTTTETSETPTTETTTTETSEVPTSETTATSESPATSATGTTEQPTTDAPIASTTETTATTSGTVSPTSETATQESSNPATSTPAGTEASSTEQGIRSSATDGPSTSSTSPSDGGAGAGDASENEGVAGGAASEAPATEASGTTQAKALANTGANVAVLALTSLLLMAAAAGLILTARRRSARRH